MDPISAFTLATTVLTVLDQGAKLAMLGYKACKYRQPLPELVEMGTSFDSAINSLRTGVQQSLQDEACNVDDQSLLDLCERSQACASQLLKELTELEMRDRNGKWRQVVSISFRSWRKRDTLKKLSQEMRGHESAINTRMLVSLRLQHESLKKLEDLRFNTTEPSHQERVLSSLYFREMDARMEEISKAHAKTFEWIFADSGDQRREYWNNFAAWLEEGNDLYWIAGLPGAGKSTLMRFIHGDNRTEELLRKWTDDKSLVRVAFFLWNSGTAALQKNVRGLLRTCLYQILEQCNQLIDTIVPSGLPNVPLWTETRLWEALQKCFESERPSSTFFLLLDGLDELDEDQEQLIRNVMDLSRLPNVKFCVSSRQDLVFERAFEGCSKLRIQHLTNLDISSFALDELTSEETLPLGIDLSEHEIQVLRRAVADRAEGVFLWAKLAIKSLTKGMFNCDSFKQLLRRLEQLPTELHDLYRHLYDQIPQMYKEEAVRYFLMLVAITNGAFDDKGQYKYLPSVLTLSLAKIEDEVPYPTTFSTIEAAWTKECKLTTTRLRVCCGGFLEIGAIRRMGLRSEDDAATIKGDSNLRIYDEDGVRFSHRSAREFLLENTDLWTYSKQKNHVEYWEPDLALAKAHVRRLELLYCTHNHELRLFFYEYYHTLQHLQEFEQNSGRSCEDTLTKLSLIGSKIVKNLKPQAGWPDVLTWTIFAGRFYSMPYGGPAVDIYGIGALWGLKNTVRNCLAKSLAKPTYLLQCATSSIVSRIEPNRPPEFCFFRIPDSNEWKFLSFGVFETLLKAGEGADPNEKYLPRPTTDNKLEHGTKSRSGSGYCIHRGCNTLNLVEAQRSRDIYCTAWTSLLNTIIQIRCHRVRGYAHMTLGLVSLFLQHGADLKALSYEDKSSMLPVLVQIKFQDLPIKIATAISARMNARALLNTLSPINERAEDLNSEDYWKDRKLHQDLVETTRKEQARPASILSKVFYRLEVTKVGFELVNHTDELELFDYTGRLELVSHNCGLYLVPTTATAPSDPEDWSNLDAKPYTSADLLPDGRHEGAQQDVLRVCDEKKDGKPQETSEPGIRSCFKTIDQENEQKNQSVWIHSDNLSLSYALPYTVQKYTYSAESPVHTDDTDISFEDVRADVLQFASKSISLIGEALNLPQLMDYKVSKIELDPNQDPVSWLVVSEEIQSTRS